jgi:hypothetical protein
MAWKGSELKFDHNRDSKYKLEGKHKTVKCIECHVPSTKDGPLSSARFRNLKGKSCASAGCHKDPHNNELGANCTYCHTYSSWQKQ